MPSEGEEKKEGEGNCNSNSNRTTYRSHYSPGEEKEVEVDESELPDLDLFDLSDLDPKPKLDRRASKRESVRRRKKIEEVSVS